MWSAVFNNGDKLQNLCSRPEVIAGNPDDLPDIHWDDEMKSKP